MMMMMMIIYIENDLNKADRPYRFAVFTVLIIYYQA
jgi:hypothetical protein